MVVSGAPRCPYCGADLGWEEVRCPYCGRSLVAHQQTLPGGLLRGPFPRELRVERHGLVRACHRLYDGDLLLGTFTQRWPAGVRFLSPRGHRYRTRRKHMVRLVLHWTCGHDLVAWVEQPRVWIRKYRLQYGGTSYYLSSVSPMSLRFLLHDEERTLLAKIDPPVPFRRAPNLMLHGPLPLELVALAYATALVFWRQAVTS